MKKICTHCKSDGKWTPTPIYRLDRYLTNYFKVGHGVKYPYEIGKNVAYNIQYLQFQSKILKEFDVTPVICTQTWKMYIVVGTSIVECILYFLIISKGLQKNTSWEVMKKTKNNVDIGDKYRSSVENIVSKKLDEPLNLDMTFKTMIDIVRKNKLLGQEHDIYKQLNYLRKLRNRVHLQMIEGSYSTDWFKFNADDIKTMKKVLYIFFTSSFFKPSKEDKEIFNFLIQ